MMKTPVRMKDTDAQWLVIASVCDCEHVALTVMHRDVVDSESVMEDTESEVLGYGADWQPLVAGVMLAMADRTGCPLDVGRCTAVWLKRADFMRPTAEESAAEDAITSEAYEILASIPLPDGVMTAPQTAWDGVRPLDWYRVMHQAEQIRDHYPLGLASVWHHINRRDFEKARAQLEPVIADIKSGYWKPRAIPLSAKDIDTDGGRQ